MGKRGRHWALRKLQVSAIGLVVSVKPEQLSPAKSLESNARSHLPTSSLWPNDAVESEREVLECT